MLASKRVVAILTLLVSVLVLIGSLAASVGLWFIWSPVTERTTRVFGRIESALDKVDNGLAQVRRSLDRALEHLATARKEHLAEDKGPKPKISGRKTMALTLQRKFAPELDDAVDKLGTVAGAAVVVNSVLKDMGEMPALSLDHDRLTEVNRGLAKLGPAAWELSRLLGDSEENTDEQFSRIENDLRAFGATLTEYESKVRLVREQADQLKDQVQRWTSFTVIAGSALFLWIALSQVCMLKHAWAWVKPVRE